MAKFEDIIQGNILVFVDFFATWCGPCKMMHPVLEGLKKQWVNSYQVQAVPTLMLFKTGKMVWWQSGVMQATQICQAIEKKPLIISILCLIYSRSSKPRMYKII